MGERGVKRVIANVVEREGLDRRFTVIMLKKNINFTQMLLISILTLLIK